MIRAILFTALGFWISRQFYEKYDLTRNAHRNREMGQRMTDYLTEAGWTKEEIEEARMTILK